MSKVFKILGTISGVVSMVGNIVAPGNPISAALAVNSAIMGTLAKVTAKKPPAQGSLTTILIQANAATPYLMGETYYGGVMRHDVGYGGKVSKVQNPYREMPVVYSGCGPVQGLVGMYADFIQVPFSGSAATGYYAGFMYRDTQLGLTPEPEALAPNWGGMPGWSTAHKLSGKAAILWGLKFDKDGEKFAGAVPQLGAIWQGVKVYDPRLDSTRPGGSGSHRIDNEATWTYSQNPALHALAYAYGRYKSGKKIFGIGLPADAILIANFTAWANVCTANGWKVGGVIFEPGDRWANLKRIMAAGSAEPIFAGGALSVKYDAPRVSLVTITSEDMADTDGRVRAMQTWRDRINTIVPKYRSSLHKWEYVESAAIVGASYLAEDGEEKIDTYQVDLCQDKNQAAQLAAYKLVNGRELSPIEITLKPEFRFYRPGDMVTINEPELGLINQDCVIIRRVVDPQNFSVQFTLMSETAAKHDFALGRTGTAPPTPTLVAPEEKDAAAKINSIADPSYFVQPNPPAISNPGDIWQGEDARFWRRLDDIYLSVGGNRLMIGGALITTTWTPNATQPVLDVTDAIEALALDAKVTADGKVQSFYAPTPPAAEGIGDLWFDTDDGNKQYRWSGSAWVAVQDTAIGDALDAAAAADAKADGKVTTFISETTPTAEGSGDLWFKASTGELRRWNGATWGDPLVDLTIAAQITVVPPPTFTLYRTWDGTVKPDQLPETLRPAVTRGGADYRTNDAVHYSVVGTGGLAGKVSVENDDGDASKGDVTLADTITGAGTFQLSVTVGGVAVGTYTTQVQTVDDGRPIDNGGAGGTDSSLEAVTSTSFAVISGQDVDDPLMDVAIGSGQTLKLSVNFYYTKAGPTPNSMTCDAQYSSDGVTWNAMNSGPATAEGTAAYTTQDPYQQVVGEMIGSFTKTGLSPGTYKVRLRGKKTSDISNSLTPVSGGATSLKS